MALYLLFAIGRRCLCFLDRFGAARTTNEVAYFYFTIFGIGVITLSRNLDSSVWKDGSVCFEFGC